MRINFDPPPNPVNVSDEKPGNTCLLIFKETGEVGNTSLNHDRGIILLNAIQQLIPPIHPIVYHMALQNYLRVIIF
jgi:hypothetical protein